MLTRRGLQGILLSCSPEVALSLAYRLLPLLTVFVLYSSAHAAPPQELRETVSEDPPVSQLTWDGVGAVRRNGRRMSVEQFAWHTGDPRTANRSLYRRPSLYLAGIGGAGLAVSASAIVLWSGGLTYLGTRCLATRLVRCEGAPGVGQALSDVAIGGAIVGGIGLAGGAASLGLETLLAGRGGALLRWYTPADVRRRIDAARDGATVEPSASVGLRGTRLVGRF